MTVEAEKSRSYPPSNAPGNLRGSNKGAGLGAISMLQTLPVQPPVFRITFQVEIDSIRNVNLAKAKENEEWSVIVRIFHLNDKPLATTEAFPITNPSGEVQITLAISMDMSTWGDIDSLVSRPLVFNFYDVELVRDKKKQGPEEKVDLVGQATFDLMPFVLGATTVSQLAPVYAPGKKEGENGSRESAAAITIRAQAPPVIPPQYSACMNILTINLEGCFSMPSDWTPPSAMAHPGSGSFTFVTGIPTNEDRQRLLIVPGKLPDSSGLSKHPMKKWPPNPLLVADTLHMDEPVPSKTQEEKASIPSESDPTKRPNIELNMEFRCVLSPDAENHLRSRLASSRIWPIEMFSLIYPEKHITTKKKQAEGQGSTSDEPTITRHGVAYADVSSLLLPGKQSFAAAVKVHQFNFADFLHLTSQTKPNAYELYSAPAVVPGTPVDERAISNQKKLPPDALSAHNLRRSLASALPSQDIVPQGTTHSVEAENDPYTSFGTYMFLRMNLLKPLIQKKERIFSPASVRQIVQERAESLFPNDNGLAETEGFRSQVIACRDELALVYGAEHGRFDEWTHIVKGVEAKFAASGQLQATKKKLKRHILDIVRDRFYRTKPFEDAIQYNEYLADLYCALMREMNIALHNHEGETHDLHGTATGDFNRSPDYHLRMMSFEAELDGDLERAESYLRKRTSTDWETVDAWKDLGLFHLRHRKWEDAQTSFVEALYLHPDDVDAMILVGYTFSEQGKQNHAQIFFEAVCTLLPHSCVANTTLGLFFESLPDDATGANGLLRSRAYFKANECLGVTDQELARYKNDIRNQQRIHGSEIPLYPQGNDAIKEAENILRRLFYPRTAGPSSPLDSGKVLDTPLLAKRPSIIDYEDDHPSNQDPTGKPWYQNIFWYSFRFFCLSGLSRFATKCMAKLTNVCPVNDPEYWRSAVSLLISQKNYDAAQHLLSQLEELGETSAHFYVQCGNLKFAQKEYNLCALLYDKALSSEDLENTDAFALHHRYATLCELQRSNAKARKMYHATAMLHGTSRSWIGCGVASFHRGEYVDAEYALRKALNFDRKDGRSWGYLALILHKSEDRDGARRCLNNANHWGITGDQRLANLLKGIESSKE